MRMSGRRPLPTLLLLVTIPVLVAAQQQPQAPPVDIRQLMTAAEFQAAGLGRLSSDELHALNQWLTRYTVAAIAAASGGSTEAVIESRIAGEFTGWEGETVFVLDNGQVWQQASYAYHYHYAYRPRVTIVRTSSGYRMHVERVTPTIMVRRLR